ncbi:MAG: gliding motility-associated C-terminal domain-containing protein, partial [Bacteroidales bacterium]|nr:gliding motility-associated C-terminal domain-containing protein [Bacteroidales bacterium]
VCEGATATLKVTANQNIPNASSRTWEYRAPGATAWQAVPLGAGAFFGATASETMTGSTAELTLENVPYSLDGYEFRFQSDGTYSKEPNGVLVVRPVNDLHVLVSADPNPASDYQGFDHTTLKALVYVGGEPIGGQVPDGAKVLTDEELELYGYTDYDWYQIAPGKPLDPSFLQVYIPNSSIFNTDDGDVHLKTLTVKDLTYKDHDSTRYFAILRSDCFPNTDKENQKIAGHYAGLHSDTTILRIYEDLLLEWTAADWYTVDTLDYDTPMDALYVQDLPTDEVIGVHLDHEPLPDSWDEKHQVSSAYYLKCGSGTTDAYLNVEVRKGVQSNEEALIIATRKWFYRTGPDDEWHAILPDQSFGLDFPDGNMVDLAEGRRSLTLQGVTYDMHGWQFMSVALADSIGQNEDGSANYRYRDTTPVLTLVVSEPLPDDFGYLPFEDEGSCEPYNYTFALNATHETYNYEWKIKYPDDDDFQVIDTLKNKDVFHYGPASPEEDGTIVRTIVYNACGADSIEAVLRVMTVEIEAETTDVCVDGIITLTATVHNGGDNPTYEWYVSGQLMEDQTGSTFTFNPSQLPETVTPDENGRYPVEVRVKADPTLPCVNPMACADTMVTVHALPTGFTPVADPDEITVGENTTLTVNGLSAGSTVVWSPGEAVVDSTAVTTGTMPIESSGSHWFYATVTNEYGCSATDSVEVTVESSFTLDSTGAVVVVQPSLPRVNPQFDPDGTHEAPDTTLQIIMIGDTLRIIACENSIAFVSLFTSGGEPPLLYEWVGIDTMTYDELADFGYDYSAENPLPDSVFALYLDGEVSEFEVTVTDKGGNGLSVKVYGFITYYVTQHVALEAIPHMRHNRFYEDQIIFFTAHPNRFSWYNFYDYNVTVDEVKDEQHSEKNLYKTDYKYEEGAERLVYVSVADKNGCRSYDSVAISLMPLPNAMVFNDPNYPEADVLFPEFEVEIHDSWGRLVKAMDHGLGWDGMRRGKPVEAGTYYYRVKLPTVDGFTYIKGAVTVFTKK